MFAPVFKYLHRISANDLCKLNLSSVFTANKIAITSNTFSFVGGYPSGWAESPQISGALLLFSLLYLFITSQVLFDRKTTSKSFISIRAWQNITSFVNMKTSYHSFKALFKKPNIPPWSLKKCETCFDKIVKLVNNLICRESLIIIIIISAQLIQNFHFSKRFIFYQFVISQRQN